MPFLAFFTSYRKNVGYSNHHPVSLSPYQLLNQLAIIFNALDATISKWQMFKLLKYMQNLHQST
jgi:hypothetical protein